MGPRTVGSVMSWEELAPFVDYVKEHGVVQFINLYNKQKDRCDEELKFGDELEYTIIKYDHKNKKVRVNCKIDELLTTLKLAGRFNELLGHTNQGAFHYEFTYFMIESTPSSPYAGPLDSLTTIEPNMAARREEIRKFLGKDESVLSTCFPALGTQDFTYPSMKTDPSSFGGADSVFWPPNALNLTYPRFVGLMRNIRDRRGSKVSINVPIYKDKNTPSPYIEDLSAYGSGEDVSQAKPDHIYMDHMSFGNGLCCVQATFQAPNVDDARLLYDQFVPFSPILLALSASTPIFRSKLADVDCRWSVLAGAGDDRTPEERGETPLKNSKWQFRESRYGTTDCYLHSSSEKYNDVYVQYDEGLYQKLREGDIDASLAKFIAHIFARDPIPVYRERLEQDDETSTEHFETMLSSNWNNVRFKPPPANESGIGWRVEFRPTDIQLTDFENAAYVSFIVMISRLIFHCRYNFLLPISMIVENMERAQKRDAIHTQKFFFRNDVSTIGSDSTEDIREMTLDEIINGSSFGFPGIVSLMKQYLEMADATDETMHTIAQYLDLISKRASGELWTLSRWIRDFVDKHPAYKHDSEVPSETVYDMFRKMDAISNGTDHCEKLLGGYCQKIDKEESKFLSKKELESELFETPTTTFATSLKFKGENWMLNKTPRTRHIIDVIGL